MKLLTRFLFNVLLLLVISEYIPDIEVESLGAAIVAIVFLGLCNTLIRPLLLLISLPLTIVTLGLFTFIINASIFFFAASILEGFTVTSFLAALYGSLVMTVGSAIASRFIAK